MSISELAMLVNDNFEKPLNQQMRELKYSGAYIFETTTSFIPDFSGWYKVIVVSSGAYARFISGIGTYKGGGSGAVAISTLHLDKSKSYSVRVNYYVNSNEENVPNYYVAAFENIECKNAISDNSNVSIGGTVTQKGDFNYNGFNTSSTQGASVGVYIPELMRKFSLIEDGVMYESGEGILGYGAGGTLTENNNSTRYGNGAVIIIPLELE